MLNKLATILAKALLAEVIAWIKDPDNADDIHAAGKFIADRAVDQITDIIPGQWDDKLIDPLAGKIIEAIDGILKNIPILGGGLGNLGGLFGGK